jgi:hypothetical protein
MPQANSIANGILKAVAIADNPQSHGNCALVCLVKLVDYIFLIDVVACELKHTTNNNWENEWAIANVVLTIDFGSFFECLFKITLK